MRPANRQDSVCSAARRLFSEKLGEPVDIESRPDLEVRGAQAVEEIWRSQSGHRYAVEHTRVEAFRGQILDDRKFTDLIAPLEGMLAGRVPGTFGIRIDVGAATAARVDHATAQQRIADWVERVAPGLDVHGTAVFDELPFSVRLTLDRKEGSKVLVGRFLRDNFESKEERAKRIQTALDAKCPNWRDGRKAARAC
jgi:hypothetical protein